MLFIDAVRQWRDDALSRHRKRLTVGTVRKELSYLNHHVLAHIPADTMLEDMGKYHNRLVRDYCSARWQESGLSHLTQEGTLRAIGYVLNNHHDDNGNILYPVRWNRDYMDIPTASYKKRPAYTSEQVSKIMELAMLAKQRNPREHGVYWLIYNVMAGTGLRMSEVLALRVESFDKDRLIISERVYQGSIGEPKTDSSRRAVDLCPYLIDLLNIQKTIQIEKDIPLLLSRPNGGLIAHQDLYDDSLYPILLEADIPDGYGTHAFRRFRTTHLKLREVPEALIAFWLGWKPTPTMANYYSRVTSDIEWRQTWAKRVGIGFDGI